MPDQYKIAIVGAASLRGKELNDVLSESAFAAADFILMDDEPELGQLETVGDEVTFIQRIEQDSFSAVDFVFFAGAPETTRKYWKTAAAAGASIIDMSYALDAERGVPILAPWLRDESGGVDLNLSTTAVVPSHPVAVALGLILARLQELGTVRSASATVLEAASEYGRAALDELHQQTVGLLNFQNTPKAVYDMQVAFNISPVLGEEAKIDLGASEARMRRHYKLLAGTTLPPAGIQLLHAPVFHGQGISLAIEFEQAVELEHAEAALGAEHLDVVMGDQDAPNNLSVVGQADLQVRIRPQEGDATKTDRFWIWTSYDNLKIAALQAVASAQELNKIRPKGKVQ